MASNFNDKFAKYYTGENVSTGESFGRGAAQGASFGFADELQALIAAIGGKGEVSQFRHYDENPVLGALERFESRVGSNLPEIREEYDRAYEANKGASIAGDIAGSIGAMALTSALSGGASAVAGAGKVARAAKAGSAGAKALRGMSAANKAFRGGKTVSKAGSLLKTAGKMARSAPIEGALAGIGYGNSVGTGNAEDVAIDAITGGVTGAALGGIMSGAGRLGGKAVRGIGKKISDKIDPSMIGSRLADAPGSGKGAGVTRSALAFLSDVDPNIIREYQANYKIIDDAIPFEDAVAAVRRKLDDVGGIDDATRNKARKIVDEIADDPQNAVNKMYKGKKSSLNKVKFLNDTVGEDVATPLSYSWINKKLDMPVENKWSPKGVLRSEIYDLVGEGGGALAGGLIGAAIGTAVTGSPLGGMAGGFAGKTAGRVLGRAQGDWVNKSGGKIVRNFIKGDKASPVLGTADAIAQALKSGAETAASYTEPTQALKKVSSAAQRAVIRSAIHGLTSAGMTQPEPKTKIPTYNPEITYVKVVSPQGVSGIIPSYQLNQAIAQGYTYAGTYQ